MLVIFISLWSTGSTMVNLDAVGRELRQAPRWGPHATERTTEWEKERTASDARWSRGRLVTAIDARALASRRGPSRRHAGIGRITADLKGADLGGSDRVAPGLTRCHECHDLRPPSIAVARRCRDQP